MSEYKKCEYCGGSCSCCVHSVRTYSKAMVCNKCLSAEEGFPHFQPFSYFIYCPKTGEKIRKD